MTRRRPSPRSRARSAAAQLAEKRGLSPGTAIYTGDASAAEVAIQEIRYAVDSVDERDVPSAEACFPLAGSGVTWINVDGLDDVPTIQGLASALGIHPLTVEDALNPSTPPKVEDFGEHLYVVLKMASLGDNAAGLDLRLEQVSIVVGKGWVLTLQERPGDVFDALRQRIRSGSGRARKLGSDYLLHALADSVVDAYFVVLQRFEEEMLALENEALDGADEDLPRRVHELRVELQRLRGIITPLPALATALLRSENPLVEERNEPFLRDLSDHSRQAVDIANGVGDRLRGVMELHLALAGHRMNEVMRFLTIVATIFIPLTFLAGLYGMNFARMPELQWRFGYPGLLLIMLAVAMGLVGWFRRRGWL